MQLQRHIQRVENGLRFVTINGIDVVAFNFQDRIIKSYLNDGTAAVIPHRAILTTRKNLVIGCETVENLEVGRWALSRGSLMMMRNTMYAMALH